MGCECPAGWPAGWPLTQVPLLACPDYGLVTLKHNNETPYRLLHMYPPDIPPTKHTCSVIKVLSVGSLFHNSPPPCLSSLGLSPCGLLCGAMLLSSRTCEHDESSNFLSFSKSNSHKHAAVILKELTGDLTLPLIQWLLYNLLIMFIIFRTRIHEITGTNLVTLYIILPFYVYQTYSCGWEGPARLIHHECSTGPQLSFTYLHVPTSSV